MSDRCLIDVIDVFTFSMIYDYLWWFINIFGYLWIFDIYGSCMDVDGNGLNGLVPGPCFRNVSKCLTKVHHVCITMVHHGDSTENHSVPDSTDSLRFHRTMLAPSTPMSNGPLPSLLRHRVAQYRISEALGNLGKIQRSQKGRQPIHRKFAIYFSICFSWSQLSRFEVILLRPFSPSQRPWPSMLP